MTEGRAEEPAEPSTSPTGTPRGKFIRRKTIVSRPPQQVATPKPKRRRSPSPPAQALRRSGRVTRRSTAPPTSASSPVVIEDEEEEEEEEVPKAGPGTFHDPQVHQWVMDFGKALMQSFDSGLSGEALITAVTEAGKLPMNAARIARNQYLTDEFTRILTGVRKLLSEREEIKATDLMTAVLSLVEEYRTKAAAEQEALPGRLHQLNAQIEQESEAISDIDARCLKLEAESDEVSSLVVTAAASVTRLEAELA